MRQRASQARSVAWLAGLPAASAIWTGFLGCIPTDHLDMTRAGEKSARDLDLDLVSFYRGIAKRVGSL